MLRSIVVVICLLVPATAFAQMTPQEAAKKGLDAYKDGEFADALRMLNLAADDITAFSQNQQAAIYKYIAFCHIAEERRSEAKFAFKRAIFYKPDFDLDEDRLSPRIIEVFKQAKLELANDTGGGGSGNSMAQFDMSQPKYNAAGSTWRSALAPGWGQRYSERELASYTTAGANVAAVGTLAVFQVLASYQERQADLVRQKAETGPVDPDYIEQQRDVLDRARQWRVARNVAGGAALGVYTLTLVDAFIGPTVKRSRGMRAAEADKKSVHVTGGVTPDAAYVQIGFEF